MAGGCAWSRKTGAYARTLRGLVRDTQRALQDVEDILGIDPSICSIVSEIGCQASRTTALVVLGTSPRAKVRLVHALVGRQLLPEDLPRGCRWIRIQYGSATQVHLSLGNSEFELVEELQCNRRPWDVLPVEDLLRKESTDLTTILEVEINNQFLKDGLRIIIPPDIAADPGASSFVHLKSSHSDLYTRRGAILNSFNPVYLFAIDRVGKNIFSDNVCGNMTLSRSDEDFWSSFNLYEVSRSRARETCQQRATGWIEGRGEPAVFNSENCLDLHQTKELSPHAQFLFLLLPEAEQLKCPPPSPRDPSSSVSVSGGRPYTRGQLPESDQGLVHERRESSESPTLACDNERLNEEKTAFMNELIDQWELMTCPPKKHYVRSQWAVLSASLPAAPAHPPQRGGRGGREGRVLDSRTALVNVTVKFATETSHTRLLECYTRLSEVHVKLLQQFILASFDLARELQVVPKKIQYVAIQEQYLYETINEKFAEGEKKQELVAIMQEILEEMRTEVGNMDWSVDDLPWHQDQRFTVSHSTYFTSASNSVYLPPQPALPGRLSPSLTQSAALGASETDTSYGEEASDAWCLDEYDIIVSSEESYSDYFPKCKREETPSPLSDIPIENEEGPASAPSLWAAASGATWSRSDLTRCTNSTGVSVKHATTDVQRTVLARLSRKISLKLVKFVDCLKETYFGTLQRCLESLESSCRQELGGRPATEAMRQLLSVGRQVELQPYAAFSLLRSLLDTLRRVLHKLRLSGWHAADGDDACCVLSAAWRRRVAHHTAQSLSAHRLARIISTQILERVNMAHEKYQSALSALETALAGRLHHTEDVKRAIRKKYAPTFARLCLESTSMCDLLMYGTPDLGREIGRGQYGVVYAGKGRWGGHSPVAVKSVLPADERHYHELAMEFFYTRSIPAHPRIVRLFGSIVQKGGAGGSRMVLLVSERAVRDLHAAVRAGLSVTTRMRIAVDIIQGIRYLHSLGLVHRDIKLKNVVLTAHCRAALSDLGFCSYGALMSGSVVGTPIHMAPELFTGEYSASVDVYAFGVLFWYLCAGHVHLPRAFEGFKNKEQLWTNVKKGLRPERLPHFTDECWALMEESWRPEPERRALPGDLQPRLADILLASRDYDPRLHTRTADDALDLSDCTEYWP